MKYAVFYRNVNLGRPKCPSKTQLEQAFLDAGATDAHSFLVNGTIVFTINAKANPDRILQTASTLLHQVCGLVEPGFLRPVSYLQELVARDPFALIDQNIVYSCCVTFLDPAVASLPAVPLQSKRQDVDVLRFTDGEAMSINRKIGNSPGSPNAFLEKLFGLPATTRNWNTIVRLVKKHA